MGLIIIKTMEIQLNGKAYPLDQECNIDDFLSKLSIDKTKVAIELNKSVVPKDKYSETKLANKDVVEIVTFIGGG